MMIVQVVKKWGNSLAVRLPSEILQAAHLTADQAVNICVEDGRVIIESAVPEYSLDALLVKMTDQNHHTEEDFGLPQGQEHL